MELKQRLYSPYLDHQSVIENIEAGYYCTEISLYNNSQEYHNETIRLIKQFKIDTINELGLVDHAKVDEAFELAYKWSCIPTNHKRGLTEVYMWLNSYAEALSRL